MADETDKPAQKSIIPDPLQHVPEILETEVGKQFYADGVAKPLQATGEATAGIVKATADLATDVLKGLRLFTAPFLLMAHWRDKLEVYLEKCRQKVPEERQVESPPEIAGPVIQQLQFMSEENPLKELFLNLLTASIDKDKRNDLHPAFPAILAQLSPDEVKVLRGFLTMPSRSILEPTGNRPEHSIFLGIAYPDRFRMYLDRLVNFSLLNFHLGILGLDRGDSTDAYYDLSAFGALFLKACDVESTLWWKK